MSTTSNAKGVLHFKEFGYYFEVARASPSQNEGCNTRQIKMVDKDLMAMFKEP